MTEAMHQVLVIEDEPGIRAVLRVLLAAEGYRCIEAGTALRAEIEARSHKPDLLLIDLGLPDGDGLKVIRRVREWSSVPIVVLSARAMEQQKVAALDAGADDYIVKPFSAPELLARLRAALRRVTHAAPSVVLRFGPLRVDLARREAHGADGELHLTPLEYRVLGCLAQQLGSIVMQRQLIREVWGPGREDDSRSLRVCIKNLRAKLEPDARQPRYLITETGVGYRLRADEDAA
jgi:two-component system, OmpR family, KDP operon response regulator KdpE